jgi:hypothetical protein
MQLTWHLLQHKPSVEQRSSMRQHRQMNCQHMYGTIHTHNQGCIVISCSLAALNLT